jgi:hypothetical protein
MLGELCLISVGVFIALSVSSLVEDRKRLSTEVEMLMEFKSVLAEDLRDIRYNLAAHSKGQRSTVLLERYVASGLPYHDSLQAHFANVLTTTTFMSDPAAYETLKSRGRSFITSGQLRRSLIRLYAFDYKYLGHVEGMLLRHHEAYLKPYYLQNFDHVSLDSSAAPHDYAALLRDPYYRTLLEWTFRHHTSSVQMYGRLEKQVSTLISSIDREIERLS